MADRLVAILGGGDWADASVTHIKLPAHHDMETIRRAWREWYDHTYCPALRAGERPEFLALPEFAIRHYGATVPTSDDVELYYDE